MEQACATGHCPHGYFAYCDKSYWRDSCWTPSNAAGPKKLYGFLKSVFINTVVDDLHLQTTIAILRACDQNVDSRFLEAELMHLASSFFHCSFTIVGIGRAPFGRAVVSIRIRFDLT